MLFRIKQEGIYCHFLAVGLNQTTMENYKELSLQASNNRHLNLRQELEKWWIAKTASQSDNKKSNEVNTDLSSKDKPP